MSLVFGRFELQPATRQLLVDNKPAALGARAFDLLQALIERRERLVTKRELLDVVWPNLVVEENNLQVQISALRKILGPEAIATLPGRGYRFTAALKPGRDPTGVPDVPQRADGVSSTSRAAALRGSGSPPRAVTDLVGRAADRAAVEALVAAHKLVTITGAGGIGKTRLAAAIASEASVATNEARVWIDLAPLSDPALVAPTIAAGAGVRLDEERDPVDGLVTALRRASMLIVLDNAEHLVGDVAEVVSALLAGAPNVRLLVTSRAPLRVTGEEVYRLSGLAVPKAPISAHAAETYGAVELFRARAHAADHRFHLTDEHAATVVEICRRLDGMPLAIELAAARVQSLGIAGLCARLDERFKVLAGGARDAPARQHTMLATLDWSYDLLSASERAVFARLGVFAGGFTLDACRAVAADVALDEWSVIDALAGLVEKSMVAVDGNEPPRYSLLETARSYALHKLAEAGETATTQARHAAFFASFLADAYVDWLVAPERLWRARVLPEIENIRAALGWTLASGADPVLGCKLAGDGLPLWLLLRRAHASDGRRYLALAARCPIALPSATEARLCFGRGVLLGLNEPATSVGPLSRAVALFREAGDDRGVAHALIEQARLLARIGAGDAAERALAEASDLVRALCLPTLAGLHHLAIGFVRTMHSDRESAATHLQEAVRLFEEAGAESLVYQALSDVGDNAWARGDLDAAASGFRETVRRVRASSESTDGAVPLASHVIAIPLTNLAGVLTERDEPQAALAIAGEALPLLLVEGRAWCAYDGLALCLAKLGRSDAAARLLGRSNEACAAANGEREPNERRMHASSIALLRERMSEEALRHLMLEGARLTDEEACRLALAGVMPR